MGRVMRSEPGVGDDFFLFGGGLGPSPARVGMAASGAEMTLLGAITAWHGVGPFPAGVEVAGSGAGGMTFSGAGIAWHGVCIEGSGVGIEESGVWDGGSGV